MKKPLKIKTLLAHDGKTQHPLGAVVPPIFQNSLFTFEDWEGIDAAFDERTNSYIYARGNNPTVEKVEEKLAALAQGEKAKLFPSGMAAISAAVLSCVDRGGHIIAIKNLYGPANNLLQSYLKPKFGIEITYVEGSALSDFEEALRENTQLIYLESPSSVVFSLQDIQRVASLARARGIATMIDNSWATPLFQQPLTLGIDLEVHSCSKYIGGHSDVVAGVIIGSAARIDAIFKREFEWLGAKPAPFEAWLLLRSLRTLALRMRQHESSAIRIAQFLNAHQAIAKVNYPGLDDYPQRALMKKQMTGTTGLLSFQLRTTELEKVRSFFNGLQLFQIGVSWGGHESLIYAPAISYLKELSPEQFAGMGISIGDMRISVGLEDVEDLIRDLDEALVRIEG